jgi:hypothetical protein
MPDRVESVWRLESSVAVVLIQCSSQRARCSGDSENGLRLLELRLELMESPLESVPYFSRSVTPV